MYLKTLLCILLAILTLSCIAETIEEYRIIPQPQKIAYTSGLCKLSSKITVAYPRSLSSEAGLLKEYLSADFGISAKLNSGAEKGDIVLQITDKLPEIKKEDGYRLTVGAKNIEITATTDRGIFYGIQSLRQIIVLRDGNFNLQQGTITDHPAFGHRSFMLDEGRHFKGKQVVKNLMDEMALLKMNIFHWHLTDDQGWRIEIKKYPLLTKVGSYRDSTEIKHFHSNIYDGKPHSGFYTQKEIREIIAYADKLHIQIIPEVEMPGHASAAIAAYPWLGTTGEQIRVSCKFGVQYDVFDVTNPKVLQFFEDVISEMAALFPSPVLHIGGDEVRYNQWNESPDVKKYMDEHGLKIPAELQVFFTNNISTLVASKGKRMMGWQEVTGDKVHDYQKTEETQTQQPLDKNSIIQFWVGDPKSMLTTARKGFDIVNSFSQYTYLDYSYKSIPLSKAYSFNPIPAGLPKELENKILGPGCQMWCEFIPDVESMNYKVFPRIAAYAECGWTENQNKNYDRFTDNLPGLLERWKKAGINYGPIE